MQLLAELESHRGEGIVAVVLPFLQDVNETARFHAVGAVFAQENPAAAREALAELLGREESMRIKARILDGFAARLACGRRQGGQTARRLRARCRRRSASPLGHGPRRRASTRSPSALSSLARRGAYKAKRAGERFARRVRLSSALLRRVASAARSAGYSVISPWKGR